MKEIELTIHNPTGLHARPAKVLVNLAKQFKAEISIQYGEKRANAKSMVSILTLGAAKDSQIVLRTNGEDEDAAIKQIEALILAGMGDLEPPAGPAHVRSGPPAPSPIPTTAAQKQPLPAGAVQGVSAAPGMAVGPVFQFRPIEPDLDADEAVVPFAEALVQATQQLAELHQQMVDKNLVKEAAIFEAHMELLQDPELLESVQQRVESGQSIVAAWKDSINERAVVIAALDDPTLSGRATDLRDVGRRVLRCILGVTEHSVQLPEEPVIILAEDLSPSDTVLFDPQRVLGFGLVNGGPTSHVAILARALGLPAVVGAPDSILDLADKTLLLLDGNTGILTPSPGRKLIAQVTQDRERQMALRKAAQAEADLPAITRDGHRVDITANAGSLADAQKALQMGADGIGLLRTEFLFLERSAAPSEEEQTQVYKAIAEAMWALPVIVRTLDIGGDKPLAYIQLKPELNPFLGERGIRLCLNRPELFRRQLRAILCAAPSGNLRLMFPMVSDLAEWQEAQALTEEIRLELGLAPIPMGIMVEVPSAALLADRFAPLVDFFSIGTNDLTQYTLALDRGHSGLAARHDGLHPAVLRLIARTVEAAHAHGKRVEICGELGSDPVAIPILVGLGLDELSVSIPAIPLVKAQVRKLTLSDLQPLAQQALDCSTAQEVRALVNSAFPAG